MTEQTCGCGRPIHDTAYRCVACANHLKRKLDDVAKIAGDITLTVAKLARVDARGAGLPDNLGWWKEGDALEAIPLPVNLDAANRHDAAVGELITWWRLIEEQRGPAIQLGVGPFRHPLTWVAQTLELNLEWLRHQAFADEAWPGLLAACGELVRVVDARPKEDLIGMCSCGTALYGPRCGRCGAEHDIVEVRADMEVRLREAPVTASEAARWVAWMGLSSDTGKLRKLIWAWADRGHIEAVDEVPRYRFGDVLERVMLSPAVRAR